MNLLITGITGYVGSHLYNELKKDITNTIYGTYNTNQPKTLRTQDKCIHFSNINQIELKHLIEDNKIDVIINAIGYKNIAGCEKTMLDSNLTIIENLTNIIKKHKIKLVQISTDYVFDGYNGRYAETSVTSPNTYYGKTKLNAEKFLTKELLNNLIIRTGGLFGNNHHLFSSVKNSTQFEAFIDKFNTPTSIITLCKSIIDLCKNDAIGIYHITDTLRLNRFDFLSMYLKSINANIKILKSIKAPPNLLIPYDISLTSTKFNKYQTNQLDRLIEYENRNNSTIIE